MRFCRGSVFLDKNVKKGSFWGQSNKSEGRSQNILRFENKKVGSKNPVVRAGGGGDGPFELDLFDAVLFAWQGVVSLCLF